MSSFSDLRAVSAYIRNVERQVPGAHALHRIAALVLAERVPHDGRVLVLGAGGGMELKAFADFAPGWRMTGVDPSAEMLALARETIGPDHARIDLVQGTIDAAPDIAFDGATCLLTLHFLSRDERLDTLRALRQRVKPGAPLVVAHHSVPEDAEGKRLWFGRTAAFAVSNGAPAADATKNVEALAERLPTLSPESEVELLRQAGFEQPQMIYAALSFRGWVAYASD